MDKKKQQTSPHLAEAVRVLRGYEAELTALLAIPSRSPFTPQDKAEAQERLRALKDRFEADRSEYEKRARLDRSDAVLATLDHALHEASARIRVKSNANPKTSTDWTGDLYSARIDVEFHLDQLEKMAGGGA